MLQTTNCSAPQCGAEFTGTEAFLAASSGRCFECLKTIGGSLAPCESCRKTFIWFPEFYRRVGIKGIPKRCPTCADELKVERFEASMTRLSPETAAAIRARKGAQESAVVTNRECLFALPAVRVDVEGLEEAPLNPEGNGPCVPGRHLAIKDERGKSYDGKFHVYDFRMDGRRGFGALARVRVMRRTEREGRSIVRMTAPAALMPKTEETIRFGGEFVYVVLEDPAPEATAAHAALVLIRYEGKHNRSGNVVTNNALWSMLVTSRSRTGMHWGGTLAALVDDQHFVTARQDHRVFRYGLGEPTLEEEGFESPASEVWPSVFVPHGTVEDVERWSAEGFRAKPVGTHAVVKPKRNEDGTYLLPADLGDQAEYRLESNEAGGAITNRGGAHLVCGLGGEALVPYAVAGSRGDLACGTHGWFAANGSIVTIDAGRYRENVAITIVRHTFDLIGEARLRVVSESLFSGQLEELPETLNRFGEALKAARAKALCYHCREMHFSA